MSLQELKEICSSKEQAEEFLRDVIMEYLTNLQVGKYGNPSTEELLNAGLLYEFLENL